MRIDLLVSSRNEDIRCGPVVKSLDDRSAKSCELVAFSLKVGKCNDKSRLNRPTFRPKFRFRPRHRHRVKLKPVRLRLQRRIASNRLMAILRF